jgi:hypothetical protein
MRALVSKLYLKFVRVHDLSRMIQQPSHPEAYRRSEHPLIEVERQKRIGGLVRHYELQRRPTGGLPSAIRGVLVALHRAQVYAYSVRLRLAPRLLCAWPGVKHKVVPVLRVVFLDQYLSPNLADQYLAKGTVVYRLQNTTDYLLAAIPIIRNKWTVAYRHLWHTGITCQRKYFTQSYLRSA